MTPHLQRADAELREAERWISISRYAVIYGVSRPTVYKWLEAGLVEYLRVNRCVRVRNHKPRCA